MIGKVGKDGKGGREIMARAGVSRLGRMLRGVLFILPALTAIPVFPALSQTDPRLIEVVRHAQEGRSDSARMKVRRLLAATAPNDTLYPQIVYTQAMVASEANEMRRQLQQVAVEYPSSSWADDALLRLVQLDYASGNLEGAARNLERIRLDYPGSSLLPQASYWAARTYFDQKNQVLACRWLAEGLAGSRANVEMQNQLGYLDQRCAGVRADVATGSPPDSARPGPARTDSTSPLVEATPPLATADPPTAAAQPTQPAAPPTPVPTTPARPAPGGRFRIQVSAVSSPAPAEATARKMRARGLDVVTVQEGGLYKVRVGNYATRPEALAALTTIKAQLGGSPFVVAEP